MRVWLDIVGLNIETIREESTPVTASIQVSNKMLEVRRDGTLKIDAAKKEPR